MASPDLATHVRAEAATGSRVTASRATGSATAIGPAVLLKAGNVAEDVPRVRDEALVAAADRNEAARSPSPYDRFFG